MKQIPKLMKPAKYILATFLSLSLLGLVSSCDSVLDEQPYSQLSDAQFWKTNADAESGVSAIYDAMQKTYNSKYYAWGEFRADNFVASATPSADGLELLTNSLSAANSGTLRWNNFYLIIARANIAIEKIPQIPGYNKQLLAEAHAIRAYAYFHAIRVWGDVPLFTEAITGLDQEILKPKTKASEILNNVILPDIEKAEQLMVQTVNPFRFSKASLYAFQGEVFMYLKDFTKAKAALTRLVGLNAFSLATTRDVWAKMFLNDPGQGGKFMTGPELIFSIKYSVTEDSDRSGIYSVFFAGLPTYYISPALETRWLAEFPVDSLGWVTRYPTFVPKTKGPDGKPIYGDWRYLESREAGREIGLARLAKYTKTNISPSFDDSNIHVFRYANSLLLLGEAENQLGNSAKAIEYVNQVRTARQLPLAKATDYTTKAAVENLILNERQLELIGEGVRWWDLRRTGKAVEVMGPINGQTEAKLLFPIFDKHLIDNPLLTQTTGY
ncbi:RagB/SusD family nutrient uptake outer membrane protein [Persicitalea jodogahamensis]|uniref:RagB/SusD family nutrient uptake outer membrane protein n=1 Tax=Persicitalea jodogahamensis TaxID=402147 RepID=A0A8J3D4Q7_9BACT|nr:RagB/SusD family nutrient uptake outer membrane protein [Persicitalea jodogahamensis]GHB72994.1 hypothetical protein GCM10007390_28860 [Persicitalea jodogahamensis]